MKASILRNLKQTTPLKSLKRIKAEGHGGKEKSLFFSLNLTTLIDAFCILVIFLLSNMNGRVQNIQDNQKIVLPVAMKTDALESGLIVRIEQNKFFLDDKAITKDDLAKAVLGAKKTDITSLIIQADRNADYENIALVLRAGGQAGYEKYIFAVMPGT
ncbi:MAG: biopolymer transporter ExbD [Bdellovibrio sp.]|nr:biopolymer transporter ExbD [Bdellovibrio sp.]